MTEKENIPFRYENAYDPILEGYALFAVLRDETHAPYDYRFLEVNRQFEKIANARRSEVIGKTLKQVLEHLPETWEELYGNLRKAESAADPFEYYFKMGDRHFQASTFCPSEETVATVFLENTMRIRAEAALKIHQVLFEGAQDIIFYMRLNGEIVAANQRACEAYGYTKEQLLTKTIQELRHFSMHTDYDDQMAQAEVGGILFEGIHVRKDGSAFPVEVSSRVVQTERMPLRIHIIRDITQRKAQEEKIAWLAQHDVLTGIQNRASFMMQLEKEIQRSARGKSQFALMLFDINKFKLINDQYGHEAGDVVLRHVASKVQQALRSTDQVGRLGGDEFVVLQTDVKGISDMVSLSERVHAAAAEPISYNGTAHHVSISIGISLFPKDAEDIDSLLHCADQAMYAAKKGGGGSSFCHDVKK